MVVGPRVRNHVGPTWARGMARSGRRSDRRTVAEYPSERELGDRSCVMGTDSELLDRARQYAALYQIRLGKRLGFGKDGTVWATRARAALKVFKTRELYGRELAVYRRLREHGVTALCGHSIPVLEQWDDRLMAIEMSIVQRPYVLDFAAARLDADKVVFPPEVAAANEARINELFGRRHMPKVAAIRASFERLGIHMTDVHPGNIAFEESVEGEDEEEED